MASSTSDLADRVSSSIAVATSVSSSLTPSWHEQGVALFFHVLDRVGDPLPAQGLGPYLEYLQPLYFAASSNSALSVATSVIGLLALAAHRNQAVAIQRAALAQYLSAVHHVQSSMVDPELVKSDATLMSVLLVSLAEVIAQVPICLYNHAHEQCYPVISMSTSLYRKHLDGAVALLSLRGSEQLQDCRSTKLFEATRAQMVRIPLG